MIQAPVNGRINSAECRDLRNRRGNPRVTIG